MLSVKDKRSFEVRIFVAGMFNYPSTRRFSTDGMDIVLCQCDELMSACGVVGLTMFRLIVSLDRLVNLLRNRLFRLRHWR
jgi:hypothetical protein